MRFYTVYCGHQSEKEDVVSETTVMQIDGFILIIFAFVFGEIVYLARNNDIIKNGVTVEFEKCPM